MPKKLTIEQKQANKLLKKCKKALKESKDYWLNLKLNHIIIMIEKGIDPDIKDLESKFDKAMGIK
jgi:hypothetical protein